MQIPVYTVYFTVIDDITICEVNGRISLMLEE